MRSLATEAARLICLTTGRVFLVVTIDIIHVPNSHPKKLQSVTWSHWEEDLEAHRVVPKQDDEILNKVFRSDGQDDTTYVLPPDTSYWSLMSVPGDNHQRYFIKATETAKWKVWCTGFTVY
jgi:hypothetical protein